MDDNFEIMAGSGETGISACKADGNRFEMVAKTLKGLEEVLADELRGIGAGDVEPGRRMVSFTGDLAILYKANLCCRTALRILKPLVKFRADNPDTLYELTKEFDWGSILTLNKTFCIDSVVNSDEFTNSQFVTYRVKDAIVDWFRDRYGADKRPGVRLKDAEVMINVHISGKEVILSLDSSGESLHKRGYRVAQTEAPINEVLAAGIILLSGWKGETTFVDPMCGSGTFLIEAAMIAANINPGVHRKSFAFENWPDFDSELFQEIYNDDSQERPVTCRIIGADISPRATEIATRNIKSTGVAKYIELKTMPISQWEEEPLPEGVLVTNPPYGERISAPDMEGLYATIGSKLKNVFVGYHAWIIGYRDEYFHKIGLAPSKKIDLMNGSLECELREYIIFAGDKKEFLAAGGVLKEKEEKPLRKGRRGDNGTGDRFRKAPAFRKPVEDTDDDPENPFAGSRSAKLLENLVIKKPTLLNTRKKKETVEEKPETPKRDSAKKTYKGAEKPFKKAGKTFKKDDKPFKKSDKPAFKNTSKAGTDDKPRGWRKKS